MKRQENKSWTKLDNAAKAFPPTVAKSDTRVFRFYSELNETVSEKELQAALDRTMRDFPHFLAVLRQGLFWYYLEKCDLKPTVSEESETPCAQLYMAGSKTLLFRVTYYKTRINLEMFHSLADGSGAMEFFRTLVLNYLIEKHRESFPAEPFLGSISSVSEKSKDSFGDYYRKEKKGKKEREEKAYIFRGERRADDTILAIEGRVSVKAVLELAHRYNTTLTAFITAVFICSIGREMNVGSRKLPIVIGIPVNLRKYFSSETARNFFGLINIKYTFKSENDSFEEIIAAVDAEMKREITKERLSLVMNSFSELEHNYFVRIVPRPIKDFVIRTVRNNSDKYCTTVVSNLGRVDMPAEVRQYINAFGVIASTLTTQLCLCSFGDVLSLGFSTSFTETEHEKNFFRVLSEMGVKTELYCSGFFESEG